MEKKLEVLISSPFEEFKKLREILALMILKLGHIPTGMEFQPGGNSPTVQETKKWVDSCDILLLLLGKTPGSTPPNEKKSYTQFEYEHAMSIGKPVIVLHFTETYSSSSITNSISTNSHPFEEFKEKVLNDNLPEMINNDNELQVKLFRRINKEAIACSHLVTGFVKYKKIFDLVVCDFLSYSNYARELLNKKSFQQKNITELLQKLSVNINNHITDDFSWIDIMTLANENDKSNSSRYFKLFKDENNEIKNWLKVRYSSKHRSGKQFLIPVEVPTKSKTSKCSYTPWSGSGEAFLSGTVGYIPSVKEEFKTKNYAIPKSELERILNQYKEWSETHYFSSLLAIAIVSDSKNNDILGVLNINFKSERVLGSEKILDNVNNDNWLELVEPCLNVLKIALKNEF